MVIKKILFWGIILFHTNVLGCELSKKIVSLSGPVTMLLEELDLLKNKKVLAVSKFHPLKDEFRGEILAGGLFLSKRSLLKYQQSHLFYDQNKEFTAILKKLKFKTVHSLSTRGMDSIASTKYSIKFLRPYLKNCKNKINSIISQVNEVEMMLTQMKKKLRIIFFLGEIQQKLPQLIIGEDGFVKSLKKNSLFQTYPSSLSYVSWSKKVLGTLKEYKKVGVTEGPFERVKWEKINSTQFNLRFRGVLTPGIRQVLFLKSFLTQHKQGQLFQAK